MKAWWSKLAARVDALSLRERFLVFLVIVGALGAAAHLLYIAPLLKLQKVLAAQIDTSSADAEAQIGRLQMDIEARRAARAADLARETQRVQAELDAVERELAQLADSTRDAVALPAMLRRVLKRSDKVALVRVASAADGAAPGPAPAQGSGLDITLAGGYLDLMEYLATLEGALPLARWSALRFSAETIPAQVAVRVATPRAGP